MPIKQPSALKYAALTECLLTCDCLACVCDGHVQGLHQTLCSLWSTMATPWSIGHSSPWLFSTAAGNHRQAAGCTQVTWTARSFQLASHSIPKTLQHQDLRYQPWTWPLKSQSTALQSRRHGPCCSSCRQGMSLSSLQGRSLMLWASSICHLWSSPSQAALTWSCTSTHQSASRTLSQV